MVRSYDEELKYLEKISANAWKIKKGFVPNMKVSESYHKVYILIRYKFMSCKSDVLYGVLWLIILGRRHFLH